MTKKHYIFLKKKSKETYRNLRKRLEEYNEETNSNIDFHTFFIDVLRYSENDYINLVTWHTKIKKAAEKRERNRFNPNKPIPYGRGDVENPEYDKYFNIFVDYTRNYLSKGDIKTKKTLTGYFVLVYGYDEAKSLEEAKKIENIVFAKKRSGVGNKLIVKELENNELRIIGNV